MKIIYEEGFAINKDVDAVINSANNYIIFGSGGAGEIRESSQRLGFLGKIKFYFYLFQLSPNIWRWILNGYEEYKWNYTEVSLSNIKKLLKNKSKPFDNGSAVLSDLKVKDKYIINAIGNVFEINNKSEETVIGSSKEWIEGSVFNSLCIARDLGCKSVAVPIMCARNNVGLDINVSYSAIMSSVRKFENDFEKIIICFDSNSYVSFLNNKDIFIDK